MREVLSRDLRQAGQAGCRVAGHFGCTEHGAGGSGASAAQPALRWAPQHAQQLHLSTMSCLLVVHVAARAFSDPGLTLGASCMAVT